MPVEELLTVPELARQLKVAPRTLRHWLKKGDIRGLKLRGHTWRIPVSAVRELLDRGGKDSEHRPASSGTGVSAR